MIYAGIGSRKTPDDILKTMEVNAVEYACRGYELRSGGCYGPDTAYERGCDLSNGAKQIFTADDHLPLWTRAFVWFFHPNPKALSVNGFKLMCRNAMIVLGETGDHPIDFCECWTPNGDLEGGTAQALRICGHYKIPIYNMGNETYVRQTTLL